MIDWIAEYLTNPSAHPVLARTRPGEVAAALPSSPPTDGEEFDAILQDLDDILLPGITHWNHPAFFAYFGISGSMPGILAEAIAAALNVNAMLWRTSPAATELEEVAVDWLRQLLGLPNDFRGHIQDTASTSTLVALASAREATGLDIRERGLAGRDVPPLRVYCSEEAHSSVEKAAITLGIGRESVRKIRTDDEFRMIPRALEEAIEIDRSAGDRPFCIVATLGTTSTTSVDPLPQLAAVARRFGLWLHVDAAYGGAAAVVPEIRDVTRGWEQADSIVVNPHKWLFVPIDCSTLFLRDPEITRRAFTLVPDYLQTPQGESVTNLMDYGHALGRRFRALKLWTTLRYFGESGLAARLREHIDLARAFAADVRRDPDWRVEAPVPFSTVCFRFTPPGLGDADTDALNERILEAVNATGEVFLSHTRLNGRYTLRLAVGNIRTEAGHVRDAWRLLRDAARNEQPRQ
ncbi:MAG: pyridoxal-dependent decarboxylase [Gemmatimonadota bacterium]